MKIGMIGMGKLGLPVAVALGYKGHEVIGYDLDPKVKGYIADPDSYPYIECGAEGRTFPETLRAYPPRMGSLDDVLAADLVFLAVQTPHDDRYSGIHRIPSDRRDFNYEWLKTAVYQVADKLESRHTLVVISTCMPGTVRREILPLVTRGTLIYNPFFIAMGTVIRDFINPEFILIGQHQDGYEGSPLQALYQDIYLPEVPHMVMSIESAELTKVAYNTFIGFKIALANTFGLLCDRIPQADADDVMNALKQAKDRLISDKYLTAGMGDGGACHPRDLIAMSWLQDKHYRLWNPFDDVMRWRERHAEYLAYRMIAECKGLPRSIYGLSFKANTAMLDGSHAILVHHLLAEHEDNVHVYDPVADIGEPVREPHCILIGCKHDVFKQADYPFGSIIIDPFRYIQDRPGIAVIRLGEGHE